MSKNKWSQKMIGAISVLIATVLAGMVSSLDSTSYGYDLGYFVFLGVILSAVTWVILPEKRRVASNAGLIFLYVFVGLLVYNVVISQAFYANVIFSWSNVLMTVFMTALLSMLIYVGIDYFKG